jgi:hypothetical protein
VVFLAVKYPPFDLGTYATLPTTQPLLIAVGLFAFLVILNMTFMRKTVAAISGVSLPEDLAAPVPDELMAAINRFAIGAHVQAAVMVTIIVLMVIAANGGF